MRVPISHSLDKEEVRRRLRSRTDDIASFVPGGMADVSTSWPDADTMNLSVSAMGKTVEGQVLVDDGQVVFVVELPAALGFFEPLIRGQVEEKGRKLLK